MASPIHLAFQIRHPAPASAERLGVERMAAFCAKHGYCGRRSPETLLARLRAAPTRTSTGPTLRTEHPDGATFSSFPRSGLINAAQILAEWDDARDAYTGPEAVAALSGLVPVSRASGEHAA